MTLLMKIETITYFILKAFGCVIGFLGALGVIGFAGSLEHSAITVLQFCMYELHAFGLIGLAFIVYYISELIKDDVDSRQWRIRHER